MLKAPHLLQTPQPHLLFPFPPTPSPTGFPSPPAPTPAAPGVPSLTPTTKGLHWEKKHRPGKVEGRDSTWQPRHAGLTLL